MLGRNLILVTVCLHMRAGLLVQGRIPSIESDAVDAREELAVVRRARDERQLTVAGEVLLGLLHRLRHAQRIRMLQLALRM